MRGLSPNGVGTRTNGADLVVLLGALVGYLRHQTVQAHKR
jgi:hypothetical protein